MKLSWCPPVIRSLLLHELPFTLVHCVSAYQIGLPHTSCPAIPGDVASVCSCYCCYCYCCCCCCCCCCCFWCCYCCSFCCCCCLFSGLYHLIMRFFTIRFVAGRKWVCNGSRNTTIFGKISEINYMFRPVVEWASMSPLHSRTHPKAL
jgi:hypothetical protein